MDKHCFSDSSNVDRSGTISYNAFGEPGPATSVVLAVKDEALFIESALASILDQAGVLFEVIIVDDGSTDETFAIASRMAANHANLRVCRSPGTGKVCAFNTGVAQSSGQFVCLFAGDDIMPAGSLATRWQAIKDRGGDGPVIGLCKILTLSADKKSDGHLVPRAPGRGAMSGASYLMNRAAVQRLYPVPEHLPNEDTWLELALTYLPGLDLVHSDVVGCHWRVHAGNSMNLLVSFDEFNRRYSARMAAIEQFYDRHHEDLTDEKRSALASAVKSERCRAKGSVAGVLLAGTPLIPTLRALSLSNRALYGVRSQLYGLFSGW